MWKGAWFFVEHRMQNLKWDIWLTQNLCLKDLKWDFGSSHFILIYIYSNYLHFQDSATDCSFIFWVLRSMLIQYSTVINIWPVQFEAFTVVTMKNVVFWDVALCRSCVNRCFGGTGQILKNGIFWDVALCRSCVNQHFRGTYCLHLQGRKIEIELHPNSMNRKVGFCLSKSWKPLICSLKKPPEDDYRSVRLPRSMHACQF
jgi:hypothetical protein